MTNLSGFGSGFITHRCTPRWTPRQWASACRSEAYLCAETSTDGQRYHTAPVTTPSACLKNTNALWESFQSVLMSCSSESVSECVSQMQRVRYNYFTWSGRFYFLFFPHREHTTADSGNRVKDFQLPQVDNIILNVQKNAKQVTWNYSDRHSSFLEASASIWDSKLVGKFSG